VSSPQLSITSPPGASEHVVAPGLAIIHRPDGLPQDGRAARSYRTIEKIVQAMRELLELEGELRPTAGMTPVQGPGLTVTLDDAPRPVDRQELAPNTHIEDYIVHQGDLEAVMNALWAGGAEALMVMDQRIGSTSTVRCVGSVLLLEGRQYSPPYKISAIGDPAALQAALDQSNAVADYRFYADRLGLGYEVESVETITMPAYEGALVTGTTP
jgi:uncharacterized protein YlxW (UPF0749 family)